VSIGGGIRKQKGQNQMGRTTEKMALALLASALRLTRFQKRSYCGAFIADSFCLSVDDGTGLYYYRARYYNPQFGRFVAQDPIGLRGGVNLYEYAGSNPASFVDPEGKNVVVVAVSVIVLFYYGMNEWEKAQRSEMDEYMARRQGDVYQRAAWCERSPWSPVCNKINGG